MTQTSGTAIFFCLLSTSFVFFFFQFQMFSMHSQLTLSILPRFNRCSNVLDARTVCLYSIIVRTKIILINANATNKFTMFIFPWLIKWCKKNPWQKKC